MEPRLAERHEPPLPRATTLGRPVSLSSPGAIDFSSHQSIVTPLLNEKIDMQTPSPHLLYEYATFASP